MLKSILVVTITVANLQGVPAAYDRFLDYETVEQGEVSEAAAAVWGAPAMAGQPYVMLQPGTGAEAYLRFVEAEQPEGYAPMTTYGWNAVELLVEDPDQVAERLADAKEFEIIGQPYDLWDAPDAPRAMQAIGPGNELLYLTSNPQFTVRGPIDRVFIMVLAGPSMPTLMDFYGDRLGLPISDPAPFEIGIIAEAQGLPADTPYPLAVARVSAEYLIELDEYPEEGASGRPRAQGSLPPGIAMVGFIVDDLDAADLDLRGAPARLPGSPYDGRRVGVTMGPAGEWLELIEAGE